MRSLPDPDAPPSSGICRTSRWGIAAREWVATVFFLVVLMGSPFCPGAEPTELEAQVKAALLPKLAGFVEWPSNSFATPNEPLRLAILGEASLATGFDKAIQGQTVHGRPIAVERLKQPSGLTGFHVVFVASTEKPLLAQVLQELQGKPVLTIADAEGFAISGGVMNFIKVDGKIRFEVNVESATQAGLKVSSKLLQVSRVVRPGASVARPEP